MASNQSRENYKSFAMEQIANLIVSFQIFCPFGTRWTQLRKFVAKVYQQSDGIYKSAG